jgi:hypothetical protein
VPGSEQKIIWEVDFQSPPKGTRLMLIILGFLNGTPYIATTPAGNIAYNYWKRPNPPYIFFKYDGKEWQQIPLAEFPTEFKEANVVVGGRSKPEKQTGSTLSIIKIKKDNEKIAPYLLQIIREPLTKGTGPLRYEELEYKGNGVWESPGGGKAPLPIPPRPVLPDGWK